MTVRPRGSGWQANIMLAGMRYRYTFPTKEAAEDWEDAARKAHSRGEILPPLKEKVESRVTCIVTMEEAIQHAIKSHWEYEKVKTADKQGMNARAFLEFIGKDYPISAVTASDIKRYAIWLQAEKNNSGATINRKLSALRQVFKQAVTEEWVSHVPQFPKRRNEGDPRMRWLTKDEEAAICSLFKAWGYETYADLFQFLIDTGLRISEATSLVWADVDEASAFLQDTKNGTSATVPLTSRARSILDKRRVHLQPWDINQDSLRLALKKVCVHLGYRDVVVHTTRHTTASRLVQAGVDIARVQKFMRHKSIQMTMRYAKLRTADLDVAITALEEV